MTGRPSVYSAEIASEICLRISEGETLRGICRDDHMPARSTVQSWVVEDTEGFSGLYARAREAQAHAIADELMEISDDGSNDWMERNDGENKGWTLNGEHVQRSRLRADTRKWLLSKMLPKVYGDRLDVNATLRRAADEMSDAELASIASSSRPGASAPEEDQE